jgi:hypothetical protein
MVHKAMLVAAVACALVTGAAIAMGDWLIASACGLAAASEIAVIWKELSRLDGKADRIPARKG